MTVNPDPDGAVRRAALRYGALLDARRLEAVAECLSPDIEADYDGLRLHGRSAVLDFMRAGASELVMVHHFIGSVNVQRDPCLTAEVYVQSHAIHRGDEATLLTRGTRWLDDYRIDGTRALIIRSVHRTDWAVRSPVHVFVPSTERTTWVGLL